MTGYFDFLGFYKCQHTIFSCLRATDCGNVKKKKIKVLHVSEYVLNSPRKGQTRGQRSQEMSYGFLMDSEWNITLRKC
jgi:hypothetical protein